MVVRALNRAAPQPAKCPAPHPRRKLAAQFMGVPGVVSLSGGFPPADLFPFESISVTLCGGGQTVTIDDPGKVQAGWFGRIPAGWVWACVAGG